MGFKLHGDLGKFPSLQVLLCDLLPPGPAVSCSEKIKVELATVSHQTDFSPRYTSVILLCNCHLVFECCYLAY